MYILLVNLCSVFLPGSRRKFTALYHVVTNEAICFRQSLPLLSVNGGKPLDESRQNFAGGEQKHVTKDSYTDILPVWPKEISLSTKV